MSMPNNNCHVSTKWEDTGGKGSNNCDASNVLLNSPTTNEDSLQDLIEKELTLRSSSTVVGTNGLENRPKSLLIADVDEADATSNGGGGGGADPFDIFDTAPNPSPVPLENGCQRKNSIRSIRSVAIAEVDDFDVLYNEIGTDDVFVNGHDTLILSPSSSSPSSVDEKIEKIVNEDNECRKEISENDVAGPFNEIGNRPPPNEQLVDFDLDADCGPVSGHLVSSSEESSINSVRELCKSDTNQFQDRFKINFTNESNDFVAVSEVDIVTESHELVSIGSSVADDQSTASTSTIADSQRVADEEKQVRADTPSQKMETNSCHEDGRRSASPLIGNCDPRQDEVTDSWMCGNTKAAASELSVENESEAEEAVHGQHHIVPDESAEKWTLGGDDALEAIRCNGDGAEDVCKSTAAADERDEDDEPILETHDTADDDYVNLGQYQVSRVENEIVQQEDECIGEEKAAAAPPFTTNHIYPATTFSLPKCDPSQLIEECSYDLTMSNDLVCETSVAEKKSVKKKKNTSEETVTISKTKKTKKTKRHEGKENISVNNSCDQNGIEDPNFHQIVDDCDELSNVCVRDLKIMYCNEATKTTNGSKYEEPVPSPVPIKELKSVSMSDLSFVDGNQSRSMWGKKRVRDLAASFENLCPIQQSNCSRVQRVHVDYLSLGDRPLVRSLKAGFGKFDQLTKQHQKTVMHVRSSDPAKAQQQFSQNDASADNGNVCKACNKNVFAMEQIKAERQVWHKNCFRCKTCNKQLTVDVYSSHEGELYCKPHFRDLFKPTPVVEEEKPSSDKPDLGLEELSSLNVKSRFQVFEKPQVEETTDKSPISVKRSPSILSKLAKFQAKGMDLGVSSDILNGIDYEESSSSDEEPAHDDNITRSTVVKEKPIAFNKMNDVKMNWENGQTAKKEERREQRREEIQNIRSRMFMGKQIKMKEAYENAVAESERANVKKDIEIKSDKARSIKEKFEKGEVIPDESDEEQENKKSDNKNEDMDVFEAGISKKSRSIFQQMDAAIKTQSQNQVSASQPTITQNGHHRSHREMVTRQASNDIVRASDPVEEVAVQTSDISSKFKFFETYKAPEVKKKSFRITPPREGQLKSESPEKEIHKDPDVVRCDEQVEDESEVLKKSHTTAKMLSLFRSMEGAQESVPDGRRPLKKFTPPPASSSSSEAESEDESEEQSEASNPSDDIVRASYKQEDEYLKMAQKATKAKALKEKFEKWEPEKQLNSNGINLLESEQANLDTTKSLRARFESLKAEQPIEKPRAKVNRFVDKSLPGFCDTCFKKVYPLEKVEAGDKIFHRNCFKCSRCNGILRMKTFTMNNGHLYCVPHFKQLFITKGNYDEGFGNNQHKSKWQVHSAMPVTNGIH